MTVLPPERRRGIAPGDEFRHDKAVAPFAEVQVSALRIRDLAAGRGDDGVAGCDIPFASWGEARIDIGSALRHPAEFDRRSEHLADCAGSGLDEGFGPAVPVRTADGHDPGLALLRAGASMDRLGHPGGSISRR